MKKRIALTFIWIGFICAISFMESWIKFQATNITIKLGLGIGMLVFKALNIMEIAFSLIITAIFINDFKKRKIEISYAYIIVIMIVLTQTFWLLPKLNERAVFIIQDISVQKSNMHFLFVFLEIIKVTCLLLFGIKQLNKIKN